MKRVLLLLVILMSVTACSLDARIDASSEEKMQKSIAKIMKNLDPKEQTEFEEALKIIMFGDVNNLIDLVAIGQNIDVTKGIFHAKVDGKSFKEIIELGEKIKNKQNIVTKADLSLNDREKPLSSSDFLNQLTEEEKDQANNHMLEKTVKVSLSSIKTLPGDYSQIYTNIQIIIENLSEKDIKGVKGVAVFNDIFGDTIKRIKLSSDEAIKAGKTFIYEGSIDINQFNNEDIKLSTTPKEKIEFYFIPEIILFEDGSKIEAPS